MSGIYCDLTVQRLGDAVHPKRLILGGRVRLCQNDAALTDALIVDAGHRVHHRQFILTVALLGDQTGNGIGKRPDAMCGKGLCS